MNFFEYIVFIIGYYYVTIRKVMHNANLPVLGRVLEGIAIGMYANILGQAVDDGGVTFNLLFKTIMAIILTATAVELQINRKDT